MAGKKTVFRWYYTVTKQIFLSCSVWRMQHASYSDLNSVNRLFGISLPRCMNGNYKSTNEQAKENVVKLACYLLSY